LFVRTLNQLFIVIVLLLAVSLIVAQEPPLETTHPRLFFTNRDLQTLQQRAQTTHHDIWLPIQTAAEQIAGEIPPEQPPAAADEDFFRGAGDRAMLLAFACVISDSYCSPAMRHLIALSGWTTWDQEDQAGLGLAHMLQGSALAYDWLYPLLSAQEQTTVSQALAHWSERMYNASRAERYVPEWNNWWRKSYFQNQYFINNSALGLASLALSDALPEASAVWLAQAEGQMMTGRNVLEATADGTWHESIPYQNYLLTLSLPFLVNLERITGTDLMPHVYLQQYVDWRLYNLLSNGEFILGYGDFEWWWANGFEPQNVLRYIAGTQQDGTAEWLAQQILASAPRQPDKDHAPWYVLEFLYYDAAVMAEPPTQQANAQTFDDLGAVVWRTGWDPNSIVFALKSGSSGGRFAHESFISGIAPWDPACTVTGCQLNIGHDHDDAGGIYLYRAGQWLIPETVSYADPATHFHNTFLIDGQGQYRPATADFIEDAADLAYNDASIDRHSSTMNFSYVSANLTERYRIADLRTVTRQVMFVRPGYLVMVDHLAADSAHSYESRLHFGGDLAFDQGWIRSTLPDGQEIGVAILNPESMQVTFGYDGFNLASIRPAQSAAETTLAAVIFPTFASQWEQRPQVSIIADDGDALAISVDLLECSQCADTILLRRITGSTGTASFGPYAFDGHAGYIRRGADGAFESLFISGGTRLVDTEQEQVLFSGLRRTSGLEVDYLGSLLVLSGDLQASATLYAPGVEIVLLNGQRIGFVADEDHITVNPEAQAVIGG
jgi:hypothetical protein